MADLYVDHGVYGAYAATPTWNTPQEGDGKAPGTGSCAIGSVVFTQGHSAGSVAVFGATVTPATSADAAAAANNLATAINASTATINSTFGAGQTPQLRNVVWARGPANGAPAGTCQIMTRVAAASLNDSGNTSLTQSAFDGTPPTLTQFSGAASGAWGYAGNTGSVWPQAFGAGSYGTLHSTVLVGTAAANDVVHYRTKRSGANITVAYSGAHVTINPFYGTTSGPVVHKADDGVKWSGDAGVLEVSINSGHNITLWMGRQGGPLILQGSTVSGNNKNFIIAARNQYSNSVLQAVPGSSLSGVEIWNSSDAEGTPYGATWYLANADPDNSSNRLVSPIPFELVDCTIRNRRTNWSPVFRIARYGGTPAIRFVNCEFTTSVNSAATSPSLLQVEHNDLYSYLLEFVGGRATGYVAGSTALNYSSSTQGNNWPALAEFRDFDFGNLVPAAWAFQLGSGITSTSSSTSSAGAMHRSENFNSRVSISSVTPGRRYYYANAQYVLEWNPSSSWPTLNATLPETYGGGLNKWVYRLQTNTASGMFTPSMPLRVARMVKFNTGAQAAKTFTLNLLIDQNIDTVGNRVKNSEVVLEVSYVNASGARKVARSFVHGRDAVANLAAGSGSWSATNYDINAVRHDYNSRQVQLTTSDVVASDSEVIVAVLIGRPSTTADDWYFIDPEVLMS